jgi:hypothetical protein
MKSRDAQDLSAMRLHCWMVFAGLTQPTSTGEAVWETWYSAGETFSTAPVLLVTHNATRKFVSPRQFQALAGHMQPFAKGASLMSFTLFNQDTRAHIASNQFASQAHLTQLNSAFDSVAAPIGDRHIIEFPRTAMSLKTVWWIVKASGMTALPVWDPTDNPADSSGNPPATWHRVVAVDPSRTQIPPGEVATVSSQGRPKPGTPVVPLSHFYSFRISKDELEAVRKSGAPGAASAQAGDFAALVALHYTTKEIPEWVWATLWWHDRPSDGPFAAGRPAAVTGVWTNYLMATAFSMETPQEQDGGPAVCFNPWLEARFKDGVHSNCMSCHQKAVWPAKEFLPVTRGKMKPDDAQFKRAMTLDFLWSIAFESH